MGPMALSDQQKEALKSAHGDDLHVVTVKGTDFVFKVPDRHIWNRFKDQVADARRRRGATEMLVKACAVHPSVEAIDAIFDKRPALAETLGSKLGELAGLEEDVESGKL